jgi:hypothetical protein
MQGGRHHYNREEVQQEPLKTESQQQVRLDIKNRDFKMPNDRENSRLNA